MLFRTFDSQIPCNLCKVKVLLLLCIVCVLSESISKIMISHCK